MTVLVIEKNWSCWLCLTVGSAPKISMLSPLQLSAEEKAEAQNSAEKNQKAEPDSDNLVTS